ncbi:MAG: hypothetical protein HVK24_00315, partial [Pelagibacteraceae bacterium]|nr:hypothetical protein [Pelagibacteraceae bacterium]
VIAVQVFFSVSSHNIPFILLIGSLGFFMSPRDTFANCIIDEANFVCIIVSYFLIMALLRRLWLEA